MRFVAVILENEDDLTDAEIAKNLNGFELEFDAVGDDGQDHEVKVYFKKAYSE